MSALSPDDDEAELAIDLLLGEVRRRRSLVNGSYAFDGETIGIRKSNEPSRAYKLLLLLAASPAYRRGRRWDDIDEALDRLVKRALEIYMGGSVSVRFAHPSSDGRPKSFPDAVDWLAGKMGLRTGPADRRSEQKDGGLDVVAWRPFRDSRPGFAVILCQVTVQENWPPKARDIQANLWDGWIDFAFLPMTALAIPFAIHPSFDRWDELRRTVNILLDRFRLVELLDNDDSWVSDDVDAWEAEELRLLQAT